MTYVPYRFQVADDSIALLHMEDIYAYLDRLRELYDALEFALAYDSQGNMAVFFDIKGD